MGFLLSYVTEPRRGSSATTESAASLGIALGQHFKRKLTRVKPRRELIKISQICPGDKKRFLTSPFLVILKKKSIFLPVSAPKIRLDQCPSFAGQPLSVPRVVREGSAPSLAGFGLCQGQPVKEKKSLSMISEQGIVSDSGLRTIFFAWQNVMAFLDRDRKQGCSSH